MKYSVLYNIGELCYKNVLGHLKVWRGSECCAQFTRILTHVSRDFGLIFRSKERTENGVKR